jgi:hypothetical protein
MLPSRLPVLLLIACLSLPVRAGTADDAVAEAEVREVVERFRAAIVNGDGDGLRALFLSRDALPQPGVWLSVDRVAAGAGRPASLKLDPGSHEAFARGLENPDERQEEVFTDVDIRTDGAVASVDFDFVYLVDGKRVNRGLEAWQLAKTDAGWKIVSLIHSSNPPQ